MTHPHDPARIDGNPGETMRLTESEQASVRKGALAWLGGSRDALYGPVVDIIAARLGAAPSRYICACGTTWTADVTTCPICPPIQRAHDAQLAETRAALRREIGPPAPKDHDWQPMVSAAEIRRLLDALDEADTLFTAATP